MKKKCFACGRPLGQNPHHAMTLDGRVVKIGATCYDEVRRAGDGGWLAPDGTRVRPITIEEFRIYSEKRARDVERTSRASRSSATRLRGSAPCHCCGGVANGYWRSGHWNDCDACHEKCAPTNREHRQ